MEIKEQNTLPAQPERFDFNQTAEEIMQKYKDRDLSKFGNFITRDRYRPDRFPDHVLGNYTIYPPEEVKPKPTIDYDQFKAYFKQTLLVFKKARGIKTLYFHPANVKTIDNICKYFTGEGGHLDPAKGLYFYGPYGNGKTDFCITLTQMINVLARTYSNTPKYKILSYDSLYNQTRETATIDTIIQQMTSQVYIDDILYQGRNEATIFGNKDYVADIIVTRMYELHDYGHRHIITSNFPPDQLTTILHGGSVNRMKKMFNEIFWQGESLRK